MACNRSSVQVRYPPLNKQEPLIITIGGFFFGLLGINGWCWKVQSVSVGSDGMLQVVHPQRWRSRFALTVRD